MPVVNICGAVGELVGKNPLIYVEYLTRDNHLYLNFKLSWLNVHWCMVKKKHIRIIWK
jgi:hypothetical protein